ncbi:MAG TPA: haloalkane dehalogenase [Solirubrobacterales bacterium]|jgi:haloalkane dehalogenase|nr:haloalkane dehalogenase [Solirubrobacterales bacterium]
MDVFRTPEDRFADLPGFPYEPRYREWEGMRLAHIDEGDGPVVMLMHGEPTWSFLWRKVIPPLLSAGYRVVAPDLPGFGRSDKPTDIDWYTYDRHTAAIQDLVEQLDLSDVSVVVHDWGGPIGLRVATESPHRFARVAAMDTGVFTGSFKMSDNWQAFHDFVVATEDLPIGFLVKGAVAREMPDDVFAAYEAPFPDPAAKAGARAFPPMIPRSEDTPDALTGQRVLEALTASDWPKLVLWADKDPVLPVKLGEAFAARIDAAPPAIIEDAGHFLQEDAGEEIGRRLVDWLDESRR